MKIVIYARYSSFGQREESIEGQLKACHDFAKQHGYIVIEEYIDRAASATNDQRAEFQRLISDSENKNFEAVLVYQLDRFTRNRYDSAINKQKLKTNGVRVLSAKENIADDPSGIILEGMLETIAEYYSADLSMKVKRGQAQNALNCLHNGGRILTGYRVGADKRYEIDPVTAPIIRQVFEQFEKGVSEVDIIEELNAAGLKTSTGKPFTKNSFQNILRNRRYTGVYIYGETEIEDGMPRLVSDETFAAVQSRIGRQRKSPRTKDSYLLSTKVFCEKCDSMMVGKSGTGKVGTVHYYYSCQQRLKKECSKEHIKRDVLDDIIMAACQGALDKKSIDKTAKIVSALAKKEANSPYVKQIKKSIAEVDKKIAGHKKAYEDGLATKTTMEWLGQDELAKERLEKELREAEMSILPLEEEKIHFFLTGFAKGDINDEFNRKMLANAFVNKIFLDDDKATLFFNASHMEPVKITTELRNRVQNAVEGSPDAAMAEV